MAKKIPGVNFFHTHSSKEAQLLTNDNKHVIIDREDYNIVLQILRENPQFLNEQRATGRTTRLIDQAVQDLFTHKGVAVIDHHPSEGAQKNFQNKLMKRLEIEHPGIRTSTTRSGNSIIIKIIN